MVEQLKNLIEIEKITKEYSNPSLFETWNWEGDESVLPFKWLDCLNSCGNTLWSLDLLKEKYINENFEKKLFYFLTYRGDTAGIIYLNLNLDIPTIEFLNVKEIYQDKGVELALLSKIIKKARERNFKFLVFSEQNSNFNFDNLISKLY